MLIFLGDFKPDYDAAELPFSARARLVANFECAVSDHDECLTGKAWPIIFPPAALERLSTYPFAMLGIANNHVGDAGDHGFSLLSEGLDSLAGITIAGRNSEPCPILEISGLSVAIIASLEPCRARRPEIVRQEDVEALVASVRPHVDRIFVVPHWGKEGEYGLFPAPSQRQLARRWIAAGADGIFGHHSHTMHGSEVIDSKPVYYSLGNFLFDHEESREHPLTRIALAIEWTPGTTPTEDQFEVRPITTIDGRVRYLPEELTGRWQVLYSDLCRLTTSLRGLSAWIAWLRRVGPVYIPKSDKSWKKRRSASAKAWLMCIVWNLLPMNMLLRIGCWFPDREAAQLKATIVSELAQPLEHT